MTLREQEELKDQPQTFPINTLGTPITWAETAARHSTLLAFTDVMTDEIHRHRQAGNHAAARMVTDQAFEYYQAVNERSPYEMESYEDDEEETGEDDPVLGPALEEGWDIMEQALRRLNELSQAQDEESQVKESQVKESQAKESQAKESQAKESGDQGTEPGHNHPSYEEYQAVHALSLATAKVLDIHTKRMTGTPIGPLEDGHRQAAQGLAMTLQSVLDWLEGNQPPPSPNPDGRQKPDTDFQKQAMTRFQDQFDTAQEFIKITIHPSLDNDTQANQDARDLAEEMIDANVSVSAMMAGERINGHDSLSAFYHEGHVHVKRIEDEYPEGLHQDHAIAIAEQIESMFTNHAMDHEEGWLSQNPEFLAELFDNAIAGLHTLPKNTIHNFLDKLAQMDVTQPVQINVLAVLLRDQTITFRHMCQWHDDRYPDEAQPDWHKLARTDPGTEKIDFNKLEKILEEAIELDSGFRELATVARCFGWHEQNDRPLSDWLEKNAFFDLL